MSYEAPAGFACGKYGRIIVIKKSGADGTVFKYNGATVKVGRDDTTLDIRVQQETVSTLHCIFTADRETKQVSCQSCDPSNPATLNDRPLPIDDVLLRTGDIVGVGTRRLRFEYPPDWWRRSGERRLTGLDSKVLGSKVQRRSPVGRKSPSLSRQSSGASQTNQNLITFSPVVDSPAELISSASPAEVKTLNLERSAAVDASSERPPRLIAPLALKEPSTVELVGPETSCQVASGLIPTVSSSGSDNLEPGFRQELADILKEIAESSPEKNDEALDDASDRLTEPFDDAAEENQLQDLVASTSGEVVETPPSGPKSKEGPESNTASDKVPVELQSGEPSAPALVTSIPNIHRVVSPSGRPLTPSTPQKSLRVEIVRLPKERVEQIKGDESVRAVFDSLEEQLADIPSEKRVSRKERFSSVPDQSGKDIVGPERVNAFEVEESSCAVDLVKGKPLRRSLDFEIIAIEEEYSETVDLVQATRRSLSCDEPRRSGRMDKKADVKRRSLLAQKLERRSVGAAGKEEKIEVRKKERKSMVERVSAEASVKVQRRHSSVPVVGHAADKNETDRHEQNGGKDSDKQKRKSVASDALDEKASGMPAETTVIDEKVEEEEIQKSGKKKRKSVRKSSELEEKVSNDVPNQVATVKPRNEREGENEETESSRKGKRNSTREEGDLAAIDETEDKKNSKRKSKRKSEESFEPLAKESSSLNDISGDNIFIETTDSGQARQAVETITEMFDSTMSDTATDFELRVEYVPGENEPTSTSDEGIAHSGTPDNTFSLSSPEYVLEVSSTSGVDSLLDTFGSVDVSSEEEVSGVELPSQPTLTTLTPSTLKDGEAVIGNGKSVRKSSFDDSVNLSPGRVRRSRKSVSDTESEITPVSTPSLRNSRRVSVRGDSMIQVSSDDDTDMSLVMAESSPKKDTQKYGNRKSSRHSSLDPKDSPDSSQHEVPHSLEESIDFGLEKDKSKSGSRKSAPESPKASVPKVHTSLRFSPENSVVSPSRRSLDAIASPIQNGSRTSKSKFGSPKSEINKGVSHSIKKSRSSILKMRRSSEVLRKSPSTPLMAVHPRPTLRRRGVSFGPELSPELIDKHLPPATPVKKGAKPPPKSTPGPTPRTKLHSPLHEHEDEESASDTTEKTQAVLEQKAESSKKDRKKRKRSSSVASELKAKKRKLDSGTPAKPSFVGMAGTPDDGFVTLSHTPVAVTLFYSPEKNGGVESGKKTTADSALKETRIPKSAAKKKKKLFSEVLKDAKTPKVKRTEERAEEFKLAHKKKKKKKRESVGEPKVISLVQGLSHIKATSTGHAQSPVTYVVGKKKTPVRIPVEEVVSATEENPSDISSASTDASLEVHPPTPATEEPPRARRGTPAADYSNVTGLNRLFKVSPKADYTQVEGVKRVMRNSTPKADYSNVRGLKELVHPPKDSDLTDVSGVRRVLRNSTPKADYRDVRGLKELVHPPAEPDYSSPQGVARVMRNSTPKADLCNVRGLKELFHPAKTPDYSGNVSLIPEMFSTPLGFIRHLESVRVVLSPVDSSRRGSLRDLSAPAQDVADELNGSISGTLRPDRTSLNQKPTLPSPGKQLNLKESKSPEKSPYRLKKKPEVVEPEDSAPAPVRATRRGASVDATKGGDSSIRESRKSVTRKAGQPVKAPHPTAKADEKAAPSPSPKKPLAAPPAVLSPVMRCLPLPPLSECVEPESETSVRPLRRKVAFAGVSSSSSSGSEERAPPRAPSGRHTKKTDKQEDSSSAPIERTERPPRVSRGRLSTKGETLKEKASAPAEGNQILIIQAIAPTQENSVQSEAKSGKKKAAELEPTDVAPPRRGRAKPLVKELPATQETVVQLPSRGRKDRATEPEVVEEAPPKRGRAKASAADVPPSQGVAPTRDNFAQSEAKSGKKKAAESEPTDVAPPKRGRAKAPAADIPPSQAVVPTRDSLAQLEAKTGKKETAEPEPTDVLPPKRGRSKASAADIPPSQAVAPTRDNLVESEAKSGKKKASEPEPTDVVPPKKGRAKAAAEEIPPIAPAQENSAKSAAKSGKKKAPEPETADLAPARRGRAKALVKELPATQETVVQLPSRGRKARAAEPEVVEEAPPKRGRGKTLVEQVEPAQEKGVEKEEKVKELPAIQETVVPLPSRGRKARATEPEVVEEAPPKRGRGKTLVEQVEPAQEKGAKKQEISGLAPSEKINDEPLTKRGRGKAAEPAVEVAPTTRRGRKEVEEPAVERDAGKKGAKKVPKKGELAKTEEATIETKEGAARSRRAREPSPVAKRTTRSRK